MLKVIKSFKKSLFWELQTVCIHLQSTGFLSSFFSSVHFECPRVTQTLPSKRQMCLSLNASNQSKQFWELIVD